MSLRVAPFFSARAASMLCWRMRSCATCRSPPARTARTISSSVAMKGNSSSRRRRMRAGCTSRPRDDVFHEDENRVGREKALGNDEATVRAVVERALEELHAVREVRVRLERDDESRQRGDALAAHRISLVRHRRRPDLLGLERLLDLAHRLKHAHVAAELHRARRDAGDDAQAPGRRACASTSAPTRGSTWRSPSSACTRASSSRTFA